jgi:putative transposase
MDNPFIESFNGRLRDEHLNVEFFFSVGDARHKLLEWQRDYNEDRPHSSLGNIPPREFAARWQLTEAAGGEILNLETV